MNTSKLIKLILYSIVYGFNLFSALALWLDDNILLGIFFIIFYRLSLWYAPAAVTVICWLPLKPKVPVKTKLLMNLVLLLLCGMLFVLCKLLLGSWY